MQVQAFVLSNVEFSDRECNTVKWKVEDKNLYLQEKHHWFQQVYQSNVKIRSGFYNHILNNSSTKHVGLYGCRFPIWLPPAGPEGCWVSRGHLSFCQSHPRIRTLWTLSDYVKCMLRQPNLNPGIQQIIPSSRWMVTYTHICLHTQTHTPFITVYTLHCSWHCPEPLQELPDCPAIWELLYIRSVLSTFSSVLPGPIPVRNPFPLLILCRADKQNNVFARTACFP